MSDRSTADAFDEVIAHFSERVPCCWGAKQGRTCRNPARWRVDFHDNCGGGTLCTRHYNVLRKQNEPHDRTKRCLDCGRSFENFSAVCQVISL
jgi:hypothetical protein